MPGEQTRREVFLNPAYGIAANYTQKELGKVDPIVAATGSQIAAALLLLPLCVMNWPGVMPSMVGWLCVIALGIACTGVAYTLYFRLIARAGPAKAITVTYLVPVFGMLWGALFPDEAISVKHDRRRCHDSARHGAGHGNDPVQSRVPAPAPRLAASAGPCAGLRDTRR